MTIDAFSLTHFIPGWSVIINEDSGAASYISLGLFILMLVVFFWYWVRLLIQSRAFNKLYLALVDLVSDTTLENLASKREYTLQKALNSSVNEAGELWREFDESLVYSADMTRLHNTIDAEHFFNSKTMARNLTSNRLLAAVPSFLIAIGVLGTFIGLTLGLSSLDFSSNELDELKDGIHQMIEGASLAFVSSVWGVFLSLILNWIEKRKEQEVLGKITHLQNKIDYLYPRLPAEKVLVDISDYSRESKNSLAGLAEQIGSELQKNVEGMTRSMQEAIANTLSEILNPALQSMANSASQQSTQALEQLVEQFSSGLRVEGEKQKASMDEAANSVNKAMETITGKMETLFFELSDRQSKQAESDADRAARLSVQLEQQYKNSEQQQHKLTEQFTQHINALSKHQAKVVNNLTSVSSQQANLMSKVFSDTVSDIKNQAQIQLKHLQRQTALTDGRLKNMLQNTTNEQAKYLQTISKGVQVTLQQSQKLAQQHRQLLDKLEQVSAAVEKSSSNMNTSASQLGILSNNLSSAAGSLEEGSQIVSKHISDAANQNELTSKSIKEQTEILSRLEESIIEAAQKFEDTAQLASIGFSSMQTQQDAYLEGIKTEFTALGELLKQQVLQIEQQASNWLLRYSNEVSGQVESRMNEWNEQTLRFTNQMVNTVNAISGVLDDLSVRAE